MTSAAGLDPDSLPAHERRALADLLVDAVAASDRADRPPLDGAVRRAPIEYLPRAAEIHRVGGTVRRAMAGVPGVPDDVIAALDRAAETASLKHMMTLGVLGQISRAFDDAGLLWVVMKGPFLAASLYESTGDRNYNDLDLVVHGRDFPAAVRILEDLGYRHDIHNWALAEQMLAGAIGMASPIAHVDLHWHLHYSEADRRQFRLDPDAMIERARRVDVSGLQIPTFDAVDTLITLGFHAARSGGQRLVWSKDIERAITVGRPDLDEVVARSRSSRCATPVGLALVRAKRLLGADVPDDVVGALVPRSLHEVFVRAGADHRIVFDEQDSFARWLNRSARETFLSTMAAIPSRTARSVSRWLNPPPVNESDDADEQAAFFDAIVASSGARR